MKTGNPATLTVSTSGARILRDVFFRRKFRTLCYETRGIASKFFRLCRTDRYLFMRHLLNDSLRFMLRNVQPITGETRERAKAAVSWLIRAQAATADNGVSYGYFPYDNGNGWKASYPETTGYIISTLLEYARLTEDKDVAEAALKMARWEICVQMKSGAVQANELRPPEQQVAAAFNTGMVLDGWCTAYGFSHDNSFLQAGRRAGDFLIGDVNEEGYLQSQAKTTVFALIKTYTSLCAWPLCRLSDTLGDDRYRITAIKIIEAALKQQHANGWFANNCLSRQEAPLLHTIGYTLQGILEVGISTKREDFVNAAQQGIAPLLSQIRPEGFLPGRFYSDWKPASFSSCLTGSAQIAVVCYRLFEYTGDTDYREAADALLNFLKALQLLDTSIPEVRGAISGSFPILGSYQILGYPNWATKYYLDALLYQQKLSSRVAAQTANSIPPLLTVSDWEHAQSETVSHQN